MSHCKQSIQNSRESYVVVTRCNKHAYCTWDTPSQRASCLPNVRDVGALSFTHDRKCAWRMTRSPAHRKSETEASVPGHSLPVATDSCRLRLALNEVAGFRQVSCSRRSGDTGMMKREVLTALVGWLQWMESVLSFHADNRYTFKD